ncbi:MAG: NADPH-dependent 7-cyano-7-deazaguanine reductase QueF [Prolixibacteraceae bacterium]
MVIEATHLGQQSSYPQHYDPSVLVAVPRILNRRQYQLSNDELPFQGFDIWHAYEFSFLLNNGVPLTGILKLVYPCTNEFLVESKSLKLYLNSFNMDQFGDSADEAKEKTVSIIKTDLQKLLACEVAVTLFSSSTEKQGNDFDEFQILENELQLNELNCSRYTEDPELLKTALKGGKIKWGTHLLRSNCKITFQPDWGSIFIQMDSRQLPSPESFLTYIVSLRNENHFHEEICEMVFKRLLDKFQPEELMVTCLYTRRGGIDINPTRSLRGNNFPQNLILSSKYDQAAFRQ